MTKNFYCKHFNDQLFCTCANNKYVLTCVKDERSADVDVDVAMRTDN